MPLLPLVYYGNPLLRKKSDVLEEITDEIRILADNMLETMDQNNGIGLAAPQIGRCVRLFILRNYVETPDGHIHLTQPQVYINPKLSSPSEETQLGEEGCLSVPGVHVDVERPLKITIEALDLDGKSFTEHLVGYKARVVMHENDHLNGVLHIDRTDPETRKLVEPELQAIKKKYN